MATTEINKVRYLIPDTEQVFDGQTLFTDPEIEGYLEIGGGSPLRAAAYAMIAIANSEAMISKVIRTQDLQTNGAQVADAFRRNAALLFDRADKEDDLTNGFYLDIVDYQSEYVKPELTEWNWSVGNGS